MPSPFARLGLRLKAVARALVNPFPAAGGDAGRNWSRGGPWSWGRREPDDYANLVPDPGVNSAVAACVNWIATTFPEAPLRVLDAKGEAIPDHPLAQLLDNPNPYYDGLLLLQATLTDFTLTGNAYWLLGASAAGRPAELYYAPSWLVRPRWPADGSEFLSHYEYNPNGVPMRIEPDAIVHFRFGLDPLTRLGVPRLRPVLGEIYTDREAARWVGALLRNMGVPGVILAPKSPDAHIEHDAAEELKEDFTRRFGGAERGSVMVLEDPTDVSVLSFNPQQMDLKNLRRVPEERICAVLGIPAIVAGLGAGLDRSTYSNMAEAREMATESNIIPTQRLVAAAIRRQLLRHFGDESRLSIAFDNSQVRVLAEDENKKADRILRMVAGTLLTIAEGRKALGWEVGPEHEVYMLGSKTTLIPPDQLAASPEPEPEPLAPAPPAEPQTAVRRLKAAGALEAILTPDELEDLYGERLALAGFSRPENGKGHRP